MTAVSLNALCAAHPADPALALLVKTANALRAADGYLHEPADAAAAAFLTEEYPSPLAEHALDRVFARIEAAEDADRRAIAAAEQRSPVLADEIAALPSPLREVALDALSRQRFTGAGRGLRRLPLLEADGARVELFRIMPGRRIFAHDHYGDEITLVVTGGYRDDDGRYEPGDLAMASPGQVHAPSALAGEVCYALAVSYGEPRFSGAFGLLQRTMGFPWAPKLRE